MPEKIFYLFKCFGFGSSHLNFEAINLSVIIVNVDIIVANNEFTYVLIK